MKNTVFCRKYKKDLPRMDRPPFPGEEGEEIFSNVSKQAWMEWLQHQTMLINENSLNLFDESSQSYLKQQMENYFFSEGGDVDKIEGYTPK